MIMLPMLVYAFLAGTVSTTRALGINCLGNTAPWEACKGSNAVKDWDAQRLAEGVYNAENKIWQDGECISANFLLEAVLRHDILIVFPAIACTDNNVCAFVQNTHGEGMSYDEITRLGWEIPNHGCKACGSVSLFACEGILQLNINIPDTDHL